jgi:membrane-bound lytic murein transglycosylase F
VVHHRLNFLYAALGVAMMFVAYRDRPAHPKVDFEEELKKGNIAGALHRRDLHRGGDRHRRRAQPAACTPHARRATVPCRLTLGALATLAPRTARAQRRTPADRYDDTFSKYSKRYFGPAFDWRIFKAQGMAESNLDSAATSWVGARGVMQLMPATSADRLEEPELDAIGPRVNIAAGHRLRPGSCGREGDLRHRRANLHLRQLQRRAPHAAQRADHRAHLGLDPRRWPSIESRPPRWSAGGTWRRWTT